MARTFILLLTLSVLVAGLFGALHNQLSYSVGASYFLDIKFPQFGISESWQNRVGASLVGWRASWWMGLVLGVPVFGLGLLCLDRPARLRAAGITALIVAIMLTLGGAMLGLTLGMIAPSVADALPLPQGLTDPDGFLRAALMHEGSYVGAILGLPAGLWTIWAARRRIGAETEEPA